MLFQAKPRAQSAGRAAGRLIHGTDSGALDKIDFPVHNSFPTRPGGEIGRRTSFRCWRLHGREGSSPFPGTRFRNPASFRRCGIFVLARTKNAPSISADGRSRSTARRTAVRSEPAAAWVLPRRSMPSCRQARSMIASAWKCSTLMSYRLAAYSTNLIISPESIRLENAVRHRDAFRHDSSLPH